MRSVYLLGGRRFTPVGVSTIEHDFFFQKLRRRAALENVEMRRGESPEAFAQRLVDDVIASNQAFLLLGTLLIPDRTTKWSVALARETATFLKSLDDPDDKFQVRQLLLTLLIDFFEHGLSSLWISGVASDAAPENELGPHSPTDPMANGPDSSAPSPTTIPAPSAV